MSFVSFAVATLTLLSFEFSAWAEKDRHKLREVGSWASFTYKEGDEQVCYQTSQTDSFRLFLTNRIRRSKNESAPWVVSLVHSRNFREGSSIEMFFEPHGKKALLFVEKNTAWTLSERMDGEIANYLSDNLQVKIRGQFADGSPFGTRFSLRGFQSNKNKVTLVCPFLGRPKAPLSSSEPSRLGHGRLPIY